MFTRCISSLGVDGWGLRQVPWITVRASGERHLEIPVAHILGFFRLICWEIRSWADEGLGFNLITSGKGFCIASTVTSHRALWERGASTDQNMFTHHPLETGRLISCNLCLSVLQEMITECANRKTSMSRHSAQVNPMEWRQKVTKVLFLQDTDKIHRDKI